jgi:uncharacterized membrane protein YkvA (DUF1232 family)
LWLPFVFFVIRKTAPPLTTCGVQNLRAKEKRSGTQPDTLIAKTPRTLIDFRAEDAFPIGACVYRHVAFRRNQQFHIGKQTLMKQFIETWKQRAKELKIRVYALYLACKDPRVPLHARVFAACVVGYAFSPIDLIPDFIPVLGYLDDLIIVPLGMAIALRMIPANVLAECQEKSREVMREGKPVNKVAAVIIIAIWLLLAVLVIRLLVGLG